MEPYLHLVISLRWVVSPYTGLCFAAGIFAVCCTLQWIELCSRSGGSWQWVVFDRNRALQWKIVCSSCCLANDSV